MPNEKLVSLEEMVETIDEFIKPGCPYGEKTRRRLKAIRAALIRGDKLEKKVGELREKVKELKNIVRVEKYREKLKDRLW